MGTGLCTLGTSVDAARAAADHARLVIAEVNDLMPRTRGATTIPIDRVDAFVRTSRPPHPHEAAPETAIEAEIGEYVSGLVEDGATLQLGIGAIPDAVLRRLGDKHELGIGVVTTRGHAHWVVTEYGPVNVHGLTLRERGDALISLAHPDFRAGLRRELNATRSFSTA